MLASGLLQIQSEQKKFNDVGERIILNVGLRLFARLVRLGLSATQKQYVQQKHIDAL